MSMLRKFAQAMEVDLDDLTPKKGKRMSRQVLESELERCGCELTRTAFRELLEERSHHIALGLEYLPAVARRLYHSRDLGEPFDFLTWFEFAPESEASFNELLERLRATEEWQYVDREIEIRLSR